MVDVSDLQADVGEWSREQFGSEQPALYPLLGVSEEHGELVHSVLKQKQGIRLDDEDVGEDAEIDAVGDIIVYLVDFCERRGLDISECIDEAWGEVSEREWDSDVDTNTVEPKVMPGTPHQTEDFYVVDDGEMGIEAGPFRSIQLALSEKKTLEDCLEVDVGLEIIGE